MTQGRHIVVGITGASGAAYARRVIELCVAAGCHVHLIVSPLGQRLLHDELGVEPAALVTAAPPPEGEAEAGVAGGADVAGGVTLYNYRDVGARIASGSFHHEGMIVVPCSSNTLSAVATGAAQNLMHRAAHVTLKERRRLVLVHREAPLSLVDIRNMEAATLAGAIVCPASPGFYLKPRSIDDLVDFVAGRCLDLMGVEHELKRWG
ncbi:MAG: UbiX family flavin prenyltransferase [Phycisphaeraceae bacterium]